MQRLREFVVELAGTNSCIDDKRKAQMFLYWRMKAQELSKAIYEEYEKKTDKEEGEE